MDNFVRIAIEKKYLLKEKAKYCLFKYPRYAYSYSNYRTYIFFLPKKMLRVFDVSRKEFVFFLPKDFMIDMYCDRVFLKDKEIPQKMKEPFSLTTEELFHRLVTYALR